MLARVLRPALLIEVALYMAIARYGCAASPSATALLALAGVFSLRALLITLTYGYAWAYRSPAPRLSVRQTLLMVLGEYAAILLSFIVIFPFEHWWMGTDRLRAGIANAAGAPGRRLPVLLVHGYFCSRAAWWWLRRRLEAAGWTVATISLEPIHGSIEDYVVPLAGRIDAVLAETGAERVLLAGHSMGGLVARAYLQRFGNSRVAGLVTLGTPHQGSHLASIGPGKNARQMRPGNPWLQNLANPAAVLDTLAIYSPHDNFVMPQSNSQLSGAANYPINGLGHLAMLYSPRVAQALLSTFDRMDTRSMAGAPCLSGR